MKTKTLLGAALAGAVAFTMAPTRVQAQESRYEDLANLPFIAGYIAKRNAPTLTDEAIRHSSYLNRTSSR